MTVMTSAATDVIRRHVTAVTHMLLGRRTMKRGLAMTAGEVLNEAGVMRIAQLAQESGADLIHLDFCLAENTPVLRDIILAVPRENACHIQRGCRLAQRPGDRRAVILPREVARGDFRIADNEIIHVDSKPASLTGAGVRVAQARLERLVRDGANVDGQVVITDLAA